MGIERNSKNENINPVAGITVRYKTGALVFESGDYECSTCGETEFLAAGSEVPECANCMDDSDWVLISSDADSEDG